MYKNYKGNFKDIDPILYEGGAHFKYKDLYNKLLQIQPHFINSNEENENEKIIIDDKSKIKQNKSNNSKNVINKKLFLKKNKTNLLLNEYKKRYSNDNNELIIPKIIMTNQSYRDENISFYKKNSEELNLTTSKKIIIALKKREKIDYEHFFSNLNSNNEDNNIIFHYKNKNSERIPHLSNFIQKDLINDYINMKKKKLNHKIKFNFMQNKIQKS